MSDDNDNIRQSFIDFADTLKKQQDETWNSLSEQQKLDVFCHVVRKIVQGELEEGGTYRYVLYDIFGFGPESYMQAQLAGYLELHNSVWPEDHEKRVLEAFCRENKIEDSEKKINKYLYGTL